MQPTPPQTPSTPQQSAISTPQRKAALNKYREQFQQAKMKAAQTFQEMENRELRIQREINAFNLNNQNQPEYQAEEDEVQFPLRINFDDVVNDPDPLFDEEIEEEFPIEDDNYLMVENQEPINPTPIIYAAPNLGERLPATQETVNAFPLVIPIPEEKRKLLEIMAVIIANLLSKVLLALNPPKNEIHRSIASHSWEIILI